MLTNRCISDYITQQMYRLDSDGFKLREPTAKKIHRDALVSLGIHHEWSCDGHDKLASRGFPIYGIRDKWSGKWLGLWVVPNNRLKLSVAYLWLGLVADIGGESLHVRKADGWSSLNQVCRFRLRQIVAAKQLLCLDLRML
jgi:hypothetical protein